MQVTEAKTVFAQVLAELMQSKGIDPTPEAIRQLVERSGLDWTAFEARLAYTGTGHPGKLGPLADELELDKNERDRFAYAFAFERRLPEREKRTVCRFPGCDRPLAYPENPHELEVCRAHRDLLEATSVLDEEKLAGAILMPWVTSAKAIGCWPLSELMREALEKLETDLQAQQEEVERLAALL